MTELEHLKGSWIFFSPEEEKEIRRLREAEEAEAKKERERERTDKLLDASRRRARQKAKEDRLQIEQKEEAEHKARYDKWRSVLTKKYEKCCKEGMRFSLPAGLTMDELPILGDYMRPVWATPTLAFAFAASESLAKGEGAKDEGEVKPEAREDRKRSSSSNGSCNNKNSNNSDNSVDLAEAYVFGSLEDMQVIYEMEKEEADAQLARWANLNEAQLSVEAQEGGEEEDEEDDDSKENQKKEEKDKDTTEDSDKSKKDVGALKSNRTFMKESDDGSERGHHNGTERRLHESRKSGKFRRMKPSWSQQQGISSSNTSSSSSLSSSSSAPSSVSIYSPNYTTPTGDPDLPASEKIVACPSCTLLNTTISRVCKMCGTCRFIRFI